MQNVFMVLRRERVLWSRLIWKSVGAMRNVGAFVLYWFMRKVDDGCVSGLEARLLRFFGGKTGRKEEEYFVR